MCHQLDALSMHLPDAFRRNRRYYREDHGGYIHGNEPAHHIAYLYNWTDQRWKTQERVRMILNKQYKGTADGLGGNDDCRPR